MNRVEIDRKNKVAVNGVRIDKIRDYKIETTIGSLTDVTLEFDADYVDFVKEIREDAKEKSLYRQFLGKQLSFLESAQEEALEYQNFSVILAYSEGILNLAKEIEEIDGKA